MDLDLGKTREAAAVEDLVFAETLAVLPSICRYNIRSHNNSRAYG